MVRFEQSASQYFFVLDHYRLRSFSFWHRIHVIVVHVMHKTSHMNVQLCGYHHRIYLMSLKGKFTQKMITSYLIVFGALSRMVKVRGACDKPLWIYERLNNCTAPTLDSDDVLVVEEEAFYVRGMPRKLLLNCHHCLAWGRRNYSTAYISKTAYRMHLGPSPFNSAPQTLRDMKLSFLGEHPL